MKSITFATFCGLEKPIDPTDPQEEKDYTDMWISGYENHKTASKVHIHLKSQQDTNNNCDKCTNKTSVACF